MNHLISSVYVADEHGSRPSGLFGFFTRRFQQVWSTASLRSLGMTISSEPNIICTARNEYAGALCGVNQRMPGA